MGVELFDCLTEYYLEVTSGENKSFPVQLRYVVICSMNFGIHGVRSIEDFMHKWTTDEFLDMSVLHRILDWLQDHLPLNACNQLLTRWGVRGSISDQVSATCQL